MENPFNDINLSENETYNLFSNLKQSFINIQNILNKCKKINLITEQKQKNKLLSKNFLGLNYNRLLNEKYFKTNINTTTDREKKIIELWVNKNQSKAYINDGKTLLETILGRKPTNNEIIITSTLIQWLGTNGGVSFIEESIGENFKNK